jgi:hypothetical protein
MAPQDAGTGTPAPHGDPTGAGEGQMTFDDLFGDAGKNAVAAAARRLRMAREQAGHETASAAALAHGWPPSRYLAHESGERALTPRQVAIYAGAFDVAQRWLLTGEGAAPAQPTSGAQHNGGKPYTNGARQANGVRQANGAAAQPPVPMPLPLPPSTPTPVAREILDRPSEAMLRAARDAVFRLAAERGLVPQSVPWDQALRLAETWREIADAAVNAALAARRD